MKAQELRIGNLVSYSEETRRITQVSENLVWLQTKGCNKASVLAAIEEIEPIPLTEEWLLKFGFKNWGDKYTFGLKGINIHKRQRGFVLRKSVPIIKYAHQLQNLYFALTGEELFYSPNKPLSQ